MEEGLGQSEKRLALTQRIAHIGDWEWDIATNAVHWSDELFRIYGYAPHEVAPDYELIVRQMHPDSKEEFLAAIDAALKKDDPFDMEYRFFRKDGSQAVLHTIGEVYRNPDGAPIRMAGIVQDVTDLKKVDAERHETEEKFRAIFNRANDGILIVNPESKKFVEANDRICASLGYTREELKQLGIADIHPPKDIARVQAAFEKQMRGEIIIAEDLPVQRKDGSVFYADIGAATLTLGGKPHAVGVFRDITERKQADLALRESEEKYRLLVESMNEGLGIQDSEGIIRYMNRRAMEMFGYEPEEVIGQPMKVLFTEENYRRFMEQMTRRRKGESQRYEITWRRKDGAAVHTIVSPRTILDKQGNFAGSFGVFTDITDRIQAEQEREKLQEQLVQAQKMEAVGRLAGGIAHDFNNMLQAILGHTEMAMKEAPPRSQLRESLEEVERAAQHSADLTSQLLAFARRQTVVPKLLDLNETVTGILKLLERLMGEDISVSWKPEARPSSVKIDPAQVYQVLANLCVNAREAINGVGKVTIETHNVTLDASYTDDHAECPPGQYVMLEVCDDGIGMEKGVINHLFEPFFTTREVGRGTGLGLATVYGIIKQNNGFINVYSEPGQGTCFKIYLPNVDGQPVAAETRQAMELSPGRGETVLLVEDEPAVLKLGETILKRLGYDVIAAGTPGEALTAAGESQGEIQLLITDVVMPEMNGQLLAQRLKESRPGMKCLFMSGYTSEVITNQGVLDEGLHFIQKPFSIGVMATRVRQVLDS